jgi:hypothetical protein
MKLRHIAAALAACAATAPAIAQTVVREVWVYNTMPVQSGVEKVYVYNTVPLQSSADIRLNPSSVVELQQELNLRGHPTAINGVWTPSTVASLQEFQRANGIIPNGHLNAPTLVALGYDVIPLPKSGGVDSSSME